MEPRIQYAQTSDGVSIAFWTLGSGPPLVLSSPLTFSHIQVEWQTPELASLYQAIAEKRLLVRYDGRCYGLSDRRVPGAGPTLDTQVEDLRAVVDRLNLRQVSLLAFGPAGFPFVTYAARYPERVRSMILLACYARYSDPRIKEQRDLLALMRERDWESFTEAYAHRYMGWSEGRLARLFAQFIRESVNQDAYQASVTNMADADLTPVLPQVACPTLVLDNGDPTKDSAKELAAGIPNARLVALPVRLTDAEASRQRLLSAIDAFLTEEQPGPLAPGDVHAILFTDMESSTALTRRLGDAAGRELVRVHNDIVRRALSTCGGTEIKHTGDGIMASFAAASLALECAVAIQRAVAAREVGAPRPVGTPLQVRIGLNAGEPVVDEADLFGTSVQLARRICDHAEPGQILASNVVRELAAGKGFLFADVGDVVPKGFEEPVRLYEVRWREEI